MPGQKSASLIAVGALFLICAGVWSIILWPDPATVKTIDAQIFGTKESRVAALLAAVDPAPLDKPTKAAGCAIAGALPDHACTPGSVFASATPEMICVSGYTKRVRSVSTALRKRVYAAYNIAYPPKTGTYELDHFIPLALGGDNSAANLFPEAAEPSPGFKEKDVVEVYLHEEVCAGRVNLAAAQTAIARDWTAVYDAIEKSEVSRIKRKYTSWAN
ncbi:MAG: HNH endonuclease [Patescibacteria group bacterium]